MKISTNLLIRIVRIHTKPFLTMYYSIGPSGFLDISTYTYRLLLIPYYDSLISFVVCSKVVQDRDFSLFYKKCDIEKLVILKH